MTIYPTRDVQNAFKMKVIDMAQLSETSSFGLEQFTPAVFRMLYILMEYILIC